MKNKRPVKTKIVKMVKKLGGVTKVAELLEITPRSIYYLMKGERKVRPSLYKLIDYEYRNLFPTETD